MAGHGHTCPGINVNWGRPAGRGWVPSSSSIPVLACWGRHSGGSPTWASRRAGGGTQGGFSLPRQHTTSLEGWVLKPQQSPNGNQAQCQTTHPVKSSPHLVPNQQGRCPKSKGAPPPAPGQSTAGLGTSPPVNTKWEVGKIWA